MIEPKSVMLKKYWKILLTVLVVGIGAGFLSWEQKIRFPELMAALRHMRVWFVGGALGATLLQIGFQVTRLWTLVPKEAGISWLKIAKVFSLGQIVNMIAPARAGEVVKVVVVQKNEPLSMAHATGIIIADRIVDIGSLLLLIFLVGISWGPIAQQISLPSGGTGIWGGVGLAVGSLAVGGAVVIMGLLILCVPICRHKIRQWTSHILAGMKYLAAPKPLIRCLVLGVGCWASEILAISILTSSQDISISFSQALWVLVVVNVGIAVPVTLANVGVFEVAMVFGLSSWGVPVGQGLAIALVHHALQFLGVCIWLAVFGFRNTSQETADKHPAAFKVQRSDKDRAIRYYHSLSSHYEHRVKWGILRYLRDRERKTILNLSHMNDPDLKTMVEVGCGSGFYSLEAKKVGLRVCAVDVVPEFIEQIASQVDEVHISDVETLALDKSYDLVVCAGVLDFVCNPAVAFKNLCALVNPGGRLMVHVPRKGWWGLYYRLEKHLAGIRVNLFSEKWFKQQAESQGLVLMEVVYPLPTNMALLFKRV